jgi:NADH:ubiquinone oxidoreductase subunit E
MIHDDSPIEVTICMGSSCFARGNADNLAVLKNFKQEHEDSLHLHLTGNLCQEHCKKGPNLSIDGQRYNGIGADKLRALLQEKIRVARNHGTA